jgi:hypothetical protein
LKPEIRISKTNQSVRIVDLRVVNPTLYQLVRDVGKANRVDFITRALIVGAVGVRDMTTAENIDYVQREFSEVLHQLELQRKELDRKLSEIFNVKDKTSPLGELVKILSEYFDADKGTISDLLNHNNPDSPLHSLREELIGKLEQLTTDFAVRLKEDEIVDRSTLKGDKFEDLMEEELVGITNAYGDEVEHVGDIKGRRGKKGDYVIRVNGDEAKIIVVECKNRFDYTPRKVRIEIEAAMENRRAEFGIFLFKTSDQIPKKMRPVRITNNTITTSFDENGLYYAYRIARVVLESESAALVDDVEIDSIREMVKEIREKSMTINEMHKKLTQIENAADYLRIGLKELQDGIESCIDEIESCLQTS